MCNSIYANNKKYCKDKPWNRIAYLTLIKLFSLYLKISSTPENKSYYAAVDIAR